MSNCWTVLTALLCLAACSREIATTDRRSPSTEAPVVQPGGGEPTAKPAGNPASPQPGAQQPVATPPVPTPPVPPPDLDAGLPPVDLQGPIGGKRPVEVKTPRDFRADGSRYPLLILLHGFNSDGASQDRYLGLSRIALDRGYIFVAPDGTPSLGTGAAPGLTTRFWNATESCCNFTALPVDDITYLRDLIRQLVARYPVDPKRVYLFGHSNGAFMAHRMACDESPRITAIAALAGSLRPQVSDCKPKTPVAVLTIHGDADPVIRFEGGQTLPTTPPYPSALATLAHWAKVNSCTPTSTNGELMTLLSGSAQPDTTPITHGSCAKGGAAELWKIAQGGHIPAFDESFVPRVMDFFEKHQRKD